jgi:hypothetical protein
MRLDGIENLIRNRTPPRENRDGTPFLKDKKGTEKKVRFNFVIPAEAGIQKYKRLLSRYLWIPAFAGMTDRIGFPLPRLRGHRLCGNDR